MKHVNIVKISFLSNNVYLFRSNTFQSSNYSQIIKSNTIIINIELINKMKQIISQIQIKNKDQTSTLIAQNSPQKKKLKSFSLQITPQQIDRRRQIQGECKLLEVYYLQNNYPKAIFFTILLTLSFFGLLLLKHYKSLRAKLLYGVLLPQEKHKATSIFVKGSDNNQQICQIYDKKLDLQTSRVFSFKHLEYELLDNVQLPLSFNYSQNFTSFNSNQFQIKGLTDQQIKQRQQYYGLNQHRVQVPGYLEYLFDTMTKPFFVFQYIVSAVYIIQNAAMFGFLMIAFSLITTSVNYLLLRRSYNKIKQTAEKIFPVRVLRNGNFLQIKNTELVPGDLFQANGQIPCDSIIVKGDLFVNESSLTGQDVPISKTKVNHVQFIDLHNHWIFEGSKIETVKSNTLAVAINTGYTSKRGRIIRKILTKTPKQPQFFNKLIYFLIEVLIIAIIVYFATLKYFLSTSIEKIIIAFRFLDFITFSFPAPFPIFFNLAYSFCLVRLNRDDIIGIQAQKTGESGRMKTLCFDKTGTLTQNKMKLNKVYHILDNNKIKNIGSYIHDHLLISGLFACCHSVQMINNEPKGDQIDLYMFLASQSTIETGSDHSIIRTVNQQRQSFDILKINQYESKFQSMSVLVKSKNQSQPKYYIFVKGSPQMIHNHSILKNDNFNTFIKELSLEGYRSIAFGFRQIKQQQVQSTMKLDRSDFLKGTSILGVVSFVNKLKQDAKATIEHLTDNDINTKIITGDNIYLGIQTAILTGMIPSDATIVIYKNQIQIKALTRNSQGNFQQSVQQANHFEYKFEPKLFYAIDNQYINLNKENFLHDRIKVFARITPQNKALIVRKYKQIYTQQVQNRPFLKKHLGQCAFKVGMVGDGANDLIAIKQADVGIGIAGADAVYSASFAIKNLMQIDEIIRQAKNTQRQIIDLVQYYGIIQIMSIAQILLLTKDNTSTTSMEMIYLNFANSLFVTVFFGLSRPAQLLTKHLTTTNFMGIQHHLVYWGNTILFITGIVISYEYYSNSSDFLPNPQPIVTFQTGYYGKTKSSTLIFLCQNIVNTFLGLCVYRSDPWKEPFYKNKAFTVIIAINIVLLTAMFFTTAQLTSFTDLQPIGLPQAGVIFTIMLSTIAVCLLYNNLIKRQAFHEKSAHQQFREEIDLSKNEITEAQM